MLRGKKWVWAMALALGLGFAALAQADEDTDEKPAKTGNWFTRLFSRSPRRKEAQSKKIDPKTTAPASVPAVDVFAVQKQRALLDWQRRQEIYLKLCAIAVQTGDDELRRKAEQLDLRAWETYKNQTGSMVGGPGNLSPDEKIFENKLGLSAGGRNTGPTAATLSRKLLEPRTARRED